MSEDERELAAGGEEEEEEGPPSTPFDSPYFLPVLLIGFTAWFGYDGWFNPDMEWIKFNRYGFGFLLAPTLYFTVQLVRDVPLLRPGVFVGYALWLGYMGWLGPEETWFNDSRAAVLFNRYAFGASLLGLLYSLFKLRRPAASAGQ